MATIKFQLSTKKSTANVKPIHCEIYYTPETGGRLHKSFRTRFIAPVDRWNDKTQSVNVPKLRVLSAAQQQEIAELTETNKALSNLRADIEQLLLGGWNETKLQNLIRGEVKVASDEQPLSEGLAEYANQTRDNRHNIGTQKYHVAPSSCYPRYISAAILHSSNNRVCRIPRLPFRTLQSDYQRHQDRRKQTGAYL